MSLSSMEGVKIACLAASPGLVSAKHASQHEQLTATEAALRATQSRFSCGLERAPKKLPMTAFSEARLPLSFHTSEAKRIAGSYPASLSCSVGLLCLASAVFVKTFTWKPDWKRAALNKELGFCSCCYLVSLKNVKNGRNWLRLSHGFSLDIPGGSVDKESTCQCRRCKRCSFHPCVGKILWKRKWLHSSIFAWKIPWAEMPGGLCSPWGCRVRHEWARTPMQLFSSWLGHPSLTSFSYSICGPPAAGSVWLYFPITTMLSLHLPVSRWTSWTSGHSDQLERVHLSLHHYFVNRNLRSMHSWVFLEKCIKHKLWHVVATWQTSADWLNLWLEAQGFGDPGSCVWLEKETSGAVWEYYWYSVDICRAGKPASDFSLSMKYRTWSCVGTLWPLYTEAYLKTLNFSDFVKFQ